MDLKAMFADMFQQMLVDSKDTVTLRTNGRTATGKVEIMPQRNLKRVTVPIANGREIVGVEENPWKGTVWSQLAQDGHRVMQVAENGGPYIGVVVDGKVGLYSEIGNGESFRSSIPPRR